MKGTDIRIAPGLFSIAIILFFWFIVPPPEINSTPDARTYTTSKLADMGPMSYGEKVMIRVFSLLLPFMLLV